MTSQEAGLARELREALRPIWRRLMTERSVSMSRLTVFSYLRYESLTAADLARREHVSPQAMTSILHALEEEGHIERERDPDDRRRILVKLTPLGRRAAERELSSGQDWLAECIDAALDEADREVLGSAVRVLRKLGHAAWPE